MDTFSVQKFRHGGRRGGVVVETFNQFVKQWAGAGAGESAIQYGFPSQRHYRLGRLFMGHRPFSRWHYLRCRVSAQQSTYESQPLGEVGVIERFGDCFDPLWLQQSKRYKLAVVHDAKFLNWRFIEHPNRHYQIWGYSQFLSDRIDGYVVLSVDHSSAYLVDFHFPDNRSGEAANFWGQVCQKLSGIGVKQVDTWFSSASLELLLFRQLGFREAHTPDDMVPVFRSYHPDISSEWIDQNFYYNMADSDIF
ncbi:MAG: hypothetical protein HN842_06255 [Gammaproteobacteria bacterium]|nr:hypothetical protein [Gammaproteobacteria bacterium]